MTINDKITILSTAISDIKTEIVNKGQSVSPTDTVASLKGKIENITNITGYSKTPLKEIIEGTIENLYDEVLMYIRPYCFCGCNVFKEGWFTNLRKICPHAFDRCFQFKTLILDSDFVYLDNVNAFKHTLIEKGYGSIYVRDSLVNTYKTDENWSFYSSYIKPISNYPS